MHNYNESISKEYQKLMDTVNFDLRFLKENKSEMYRVFKFVYIFNLLKNRAELKYVFSEKFNISYSLLLESTYSLFSGQTRASLLLLRSYQEAVLKFVVENEREWIIDEKDNTATFEAIDFRFTDTKRKLKEDLTPHLSSNISDAYFLELDRMETFYKNISGVVHSNSSKIPMNISEYYSNVQMDTILDKEKFFKLYLDTLETSFVIIYFMLRNNFKRWDTYQLKSILAIIFKNERKIDKYISYVK